LEGWQCGELVVGLPHHGAQAQDLRLFPRVARKRACGPARRFDKKGEYLDTLDEVKANISRYGAIECCEFIKGWFSETLPRLDTPVLLAFLDVDLEASLETCVRHLWPNLTDKGYVFIDEYVDLDYCSLFWSEKYRRTHFQRTPPGLVGAGVGLALGEYDIGPWSEIGNHPLQHPNAGEYARKDFSGHWAHD
jgi:hypothetical protein